MREVGGTGEGALRRGLQRRHMTMIGLGTMIGAGLFVGSGAVISDVGPAAVLSYALGGAVVILVMRMLGEMAAAYPSVGSFSRYAGMSLGRWAGFLVGWAYLYFGVAVIAFEAFAAARLAQGFVPGVPLWAFGLLFVAMLSAVNLVSVRSFGETEFWLASLKVGAVVAFLLAGLLFVAGLWPGGGVGLSNLSAPESGGFAPNGFGAVLTGMVVVFFSYLGAEMVTIAAAESEEPEREVARVTVSVVWRVLIFYVGSIFFIVAIVPWNRVPADGGSPFAAAIDQLGVPGAATLMNVVVFVAVISVMNAAIFGSSRMLFSLAERGDAPHAFGRVSARGVPVAGVLASAAVGAASLMLTVLSPELVFTILTNAAGLMALFVYLFIALSQIRLRRRIEREAPELLRVRMWAYPYLSYLVVLLLLVILIAVSLSPGASILVALVAALLALTLLAYFVRARFGRGVERTDG